jgi:hypothetical protein
MWLLVLIVEKSPPRDPRDPTCHPWRGLVHTNHTRCAVSRSGCIQRIYGPPSGPEIRYASPAAVPAANLGPGTRPEPTPTNHPRGGYGRNTTGGWLPDDPRGVPPRPCTCGEGGADFGVQEPAVKYSGRARARRGGPLGHRAGERICVQLPSGGLETKTKQLSGYSKLELAVRHFYLALTAAWPTPWGSGCAL